jgi:ATP synthase protein I
MAKNRPGNRDEDEELSNAAKQMRAAEPYISAVWKLVGGAVVGVLGGYLLDGWFGTRPWLLVALSLVGISVGFYAFIKTMLQLSKR